MVILMLLNLYNKFNKTPMNVFEGTLSDQRYNAIIDYIKNYKPPTPAARDPTGAATETTSSNNTLLFGILTLILAIVAFVLMQVNANLKKLQMIKKGPCP